MCVQTLLRKCRSCEMITIVLESRAFSTPSSQRMRVDVEVVGRLVEQQDVRVAEQRLREQHAQLPARRHRAHRTLVLRRSAMPRPSSSSPARASAV